MGKNKGKGNNQPKNPMTNVKTMGLDGMKNIRDLCAGKFKYYEEGHIFRNPNYTWATIQEVDKRLSKLAYHIECAQRAYPYGFSDPNLVRYYTEDVRGFQAYQFIRQCLVSVYMYGDTGFLLAIPKGLDNFRYNI